MSRLITNHGHTIWSQSKTYDLEILEIEFIKNLEKRILYNIRQTINPMNHSYEINIEIQGTPLTSREIQEAVQKGINEAREGKEK